MTRVMRSLAVGLLAAVLGCASASTVPRAPVGAPVSARYVLTGDEIRSDAGSRDALDAIQRLRPWFLERGGSRGTLTAVFVNGKRYYDVMDLRTISSREIREIRYLTAIEAQVPFGGSMDVIVITTGAYAGRVR